VVGWFFFCQLSFVSYSFYSLFCFDELYLHVVENISLTYAKFSYSLFMIDSCFSHVMILCTIQGSSKVHSFLSDFLVLEILMREMFLTRWLK
jgi:hypothetical protein